MITNPGQRDINEDSAVCLEQDGGFCFVAADGLGGHGGGEIASQTLTEVFRREFAAAADDTEAFLHQAFLTAQDAILAEQKARSAPHEMKTTAAALVLLNGKARWGHVGDTRLYFFQKGKLKARTLDHSVPQMLVLSGDIKEKQIRRHPDRNRLLRVIGVAWDSPRYELSEEYPLSACQAFLLCTDGFWDFIDEKAMTRALKGVLKQSGAAEDWLAAMTREVEQNGAGSDMDNYTAVAVIM
jgi:serine/threonine protein phosphatase PrpC